MEVSRLFLVVLFTVTLATLQARQFGATDGAIGSNSDDVDLPTTAMATNGTNINEELTRPTSGGDNLTITTWSVGNLSEISRTNASNANETSTERGDRGGGGDNTTWASTDQLVNKILEGYKNLLSKPYWQQRMQDPYFLGEMLVPFTAGIAVSWLLVLFVCTVKICCCSASKRKLRMKSKRTRKIKCDQKSKDSPQWTLLERDSSDEEL